MDIAGGSRKVKSGTDITLKVQSYEWKKARELTVNKTDKLEVLVYMVAEELKCAVNSVKLK